MVVQVTGRCERTRRCCTEHFKTVKAGNSLAVEWLGLPTLISEEGLGSIPGWETKIPQAARSSAGEYQADEQAGVAGLSWRVSGR